MATLNYLVKGKKNFTNILLRFKNGRKFDYSASTELKVDPKRWSSIKQKVKNTSNDTEKDSINSHLLALKSFVINEFNKDNTQGIFIDKEWLNSKIAEHFKRPINELSHDKIYFTPYMKKFIDLAPTRFVRGKNTVISPSTIKKYSTAKNKLLEYETRYKTKLKFSDLNLTFYNRFVKYLSDEEKISINSIGAYISTIKSIARNAKLEGFPVHEHINHPNFYAPSTKSISTYLNNKEIDKIYKHNFSKNERLDNARDLLIIGLRTGLRVSDFLRLKQTNIKKGYFEVNTKKTGQTVVIPMHPQIKRILLKRDGFPRQISDQKFNRYIKDVCEIVKINEIIEGSKIDPETKRKKIGMYPKHKLVTSHICRRSFASNLYGKLPNMTIMAITGHQSESQFLKYIKITPKENAKKLQEYWLKQNDKNDFEKVNLKVVE